MRTAILLNLREVQKILGLGRSKVLVLIAEGKLKATKAGKNSSKFRVYSSDVEEYLLQEYKKTNRRFWDKRYRKETSTRKNLP